MSAIEGSSIRGRVGQFGVRAWLVVLAIGVAVFAANFLYANYLQGQENSARALTAQLQVLSQQLAKYGQEAVGGNADAFAEFKDSKTQIDARVKALRTGGTVDGQTVPGYEGNKNELGVSNALGKVTTVW